MNLYEMKLGEHIWCSEMDCNILRVPGGWVLRNYDHETGENIISQTFVPFNNEFMEISADAEDQQTQTTNSRYMTALGVYQEFLSSDDRKLDRTFCDYLEKRLNG